MSETDAVVRKAEKILGHQFKDPELVRKAVTHASVAEKRLDSNERMEFLGDSVLGLITAERV